MMNKKEKIEWIIKYARKNQIESILNDKYKSNNKKCFIRGHSNEIQAICAILSVVFIGIASLVIASQNNRLLDLQIKTEKMENKPIYTASVERNEDGNGLDTVKIYNKGVATLSYTINVTSYFDVLCNENALGSTPIRVYTIENGQDLQLETNSSDVIGKVSLHNESNEWFQNLNNNFLSITKEFTTLYWQINYVHLIEVEYKDIYGEIGNTYFIYNRQGVHYISETYGKQIRDEANCMLDISKNHKESKESYFDIDTLEASQLFRYALQKIRDAGLYTTDFGSGESVTYGEYEPTD